MKKPAAAMQGLLSMLAAQSAQTTGPLKYRNLYSTSLCAMLAVTLRTAGGLWNRTVQGTAAVQGVDYFL